MASLVADGGSEAAPRRVDVAAVALGVGGGVASRLAQEHRDVQRRGQVVPVYGLAKTLAGVSA